MGSKEEADDFTIYKLKLALNFVGAFFRFEEKKPVCKNVYANVYAKHYIPNP